MLAELIDRYKRLRTRATPPKADLALNQTYLQLYQAQRQRSFVDVQVEGNPEHYQSMVLELDPESRTVLIDELFPGGFVGLPGQQVSLSIRQSGGRKLTFNSVIQQQHTHQGSPLYVLAMPANIATDQRRNSYRLPLANSPIDSCFEGPDHQPYHGRVCNVSGSGIAIEIAADSANSFHYNDALEHVMFDFAGVAIDCRMAVRSVEVETDDEGERLMIGAEFVDLSQLEKRVLEKSIMRVQRDRLKFGGHSEMRLALG